MSKSSLASKAHIRSSIRDGIYTNLNIGMSESYFGAFMLALGIPEIVSGFGTVVPQFIGVIFQLFSIRSFFTKYSLKKRIVLFLYFQAFSLLPLAMVALFQLNSAQVVVWILSIYWASLLSLNPPWNRLIGHTIPAKFRIRFFSLRNQFGQLSVLAGLIGAGLLLFYAEKSRAELKTFIFIFTLGFLLKLFSIFEVKKNHIDHILPAGTEVRVKLRTFLKKIGREDKGKLVAFLFLFHITIHFSAPYFNPYMLKTLNLNYIEFMSICSLSYVGRVFMFRILQKKAKPRHIQKILLISSFGISLTPLLWCLYQNLYFLLFIEFLSGCYWAGFELSTILLYYQIIEDHERTSIITYISLLNTTGMLIGSLLGALFMKMLPENLNHYLALFSLSALLRLALVTFAPQTNFKGKIPQIFNFNWASSARLPFGILMRPFSQKLKRTKSFRNDN